jgi:hypothetical protein
MSISNQQSAITNQSTIKDRQSAMIVARGSVSLLEEEGKTPFHDRRRQGYCRSLQRCN